MHAMFVEHAETERNVDQRIDVATACFEHKDARASVLTQTIGKNASGGTRSDNDVVVLHVRARRLTQTRTAGRAAPSATGIGASDVDMHGLPLVDNFPPEHTERGLCLIN